MGAIANWDGVRKLTTTEVAVFEDFLDRITLFQDASYHGHNIPQTDFVTLLTKSALPTYGYDFNKEYTIASTITLDQLEQLLNKIIYDNKLTTIAALEPASHAVALYKDKTQQYYYYDSNNLKGEFVTTSIKKIAEQIFESFFSNQTNHSSCAVGFSIYDFDPPNFPLSIATNPLCQIGFNYNILPVCNLQHYIAYPTQNSILVNLKPSANEHALFPAAFVGCFDSTDYFLSQNISSAVSLGKTKESPLILASDNGHLDVVKRLLIDKANNPPDLQTDTGITALMRASDRGFDNIVHKLLNHNANPNLFTKKERLTALMMAAWRGYIKVIDELLGIGANIDINQRDVNGNTALIYAMDSGNYDIAIKLLDNGAETKHQGTKNRTALVLAVLKQNSTIINKILSANARGADIAIDAQDDSGNTALMYAIGFKQHDFAIALLDSGANPDIQNNDGITALMLATKEGKGYLDVVQKILVNSNNPKKLLDMVTKTDGETALMIAIESQNADFGIIKALLNRCADPNIQRTTDDVSAILIAVSKRYIHTIDELLKYRADPKLAGKAANGNIVTSYDLVCNSNNQNDTAICALLRAPANYLQCVP